jgi:hypothetical protein
MTAVLLFICLNAGAVSVFGKTRQNAGRYLLDEV